jgi:MraZ protein
VDEKGRVMVPAKFRLSLGQRFVLTCGQNRTLTLYTQDEWARIAETLKQLPTFSPEANLMRRVLAGGAEEVTTDGQSRMTIPAPLREYAGISDEIVMLGTVDKVEIWSKALWVQFYQNLPDDAIDLAARELGL